MREASQLRERAEQALRLAQQNTDPMLIKSLTALAAEYSARADVIDGSAFGEDPEEE
jgi:hypothetical protein